MGFTGERSSLVQAWGVIGGRGPVRKGKEGLPGHAEHPFHHALPDRVSLAPRGTCLKGDCGKGR